MRDPSTFEARLTDAFEAVAVGAPTTVDSRALTAGLVARRRAGLTPRLRVARPESRAWRLILAAAVMAVVAIAGLLLAGALVRRDAEPFGGGRILVWIPSQAGEGTAVLLEADGTVIASQGMGSRGCPTLVGPDAITVGGFGGITVRTMNGAVASQRLDTSYAGFERWSPDRSAVALVDMEQGPITVWRFDDGVEHASRTQYGLAGELAGALDATFSQDGTRLAVATRGASGAVDIHVLEAGSDRLVRTIGPLAADTVQLAMSPDGSLLAVVATGERAASPLLVITRLDDGSIAVPEAPAGTEAMAPIIWSPEGRTVALATDSGLLLFDAETGDWTATDAPVQGGILDSRWSGDPGKPGIAILDGESHLHAQRFDGSPGKDVQLAGRSGAFSPDGDVVATAGYDESTGGSLVPTIWVTGVWTDDEPRKLASFPELALASPFGGPIGPRPAVGDPLSGLCIDWRPGGGS